MHFKIDWASRIGGSKFTIFALFYIVFVGNFLSTSPRGGLYLEGQFNGQFFALPDWGAYIWRGLYMEGLIFRILQYLPRIISIIGKNNINKMIFEKLCC